MNEKVLKQKMMHPEKITISEIEETVKLQPDGWPDIRDAFRLYIESGFCHPFKMILDGNIVGLGNSVIFKTTAWLSHIIVHSSYRNR